MAVLRRAGRTAQCVAAQVENESKMKAKWKAVYHVSVLSACFQARGFHRVNLHRPTVTASRVTANVRFSTAPGPHEHFPHRPYLPSHPGASGTGATGASPSPIPSLPAAAAASI